MSSQRLNTAVDENLSFLWKYVRGLGTSAEVADDVVQECFLVLTAKLAKVENGKERSFLIGCATRISRAQWRGHQRYTALDQEVPTFRDPVEEHMGSRAREFLTHFVSTLSAKHQPVFVLYEIQELSVREVAESLEIPIGTVNSRLRKSRAKYRKFIARLAAEAGLTVKTQSKEVRFETTI